MRALEKPQPALCCECGEQRTYRLARNVLGEHDDVEDWARMTGDLKCSQCGRITRHALLRNPAHGDYSERWQRMALGGPPTSPLDDVERARRQYRKGLPRNPFLRHRFWTKDIDALGDKPTPMVTLCGDTVERSASDFRTAAGRSSSSAFALHRPTEVRFEDEYEDASTGLWWRDMDCVNCLRVSNDLVREERRGRVGHWLTWAIAQHTNGLLTDDDIDALYDVLDAIPDRKRESRSS